MLEHIERDTEVDEEVDAVADTIPGADAAGVIMTLAAGAATFLRYWLWDLYLDSGRHGMQIAVWYVWAFWWCEPYRAWPYPWYR